MHFQKPENVLKRAEDLIAIGKAKQAQDLLYELLSHRKYRTWQAAHEDVMKKFLELCVDKRDNRMAKEGLHQYKNLSQHQAPASLETVIEFMLQLSEARTASAAALVDQKAVAAVEDLEHENSPEAVLLASLSSDRGSNDKDRTEVLAPWLRFMWESYRSVLEILRYNTKLEVVYHKTAARTFEFCVRYQRPPEFRRLCETLRTHFTKSKETEVTQESVELHLATRFEQLRVSSTLKLWNEGFRTIEDIHHLVQKSGKRPSTQLEATYYQKLTDLFLVSENFLFHAYAYKAYFELSVERNKSLTRDDVQTMASCVLLSAMSIPLQSAAAGTTYAAKDSQRAKLRKMAELLSFDINPKRKSLLQDLLDREILDGVHPVARDLYVALETQFAPLELAKTVVPLLRQLAESPKLRPYVASLERLLIMRVLAQLAQVYYTIRIETLAQLLAPLGMPFLQVENIVVQAVKSKQVDIHSVRVDHIAGCIRFGEDFMEEHRTRRLLTDMSKGLHSICLALEPAGKAKLAAEQRRARASTVLRHLAATHAEVLRRKETIEKRKEEFKKQQDARRAEQDKRRREQDKHRKEAEVARVEKQRAAREQAAMSELADQQRAFEFKQRLAQEGVDVSKLNVAAMGAEEQNKLIEDTRKKQIQEATDTENKIQTAAKRLDALVRAMRERELPRLAEMYKERAKVEEVEHNASWANLVESSKTEHEENLKAKRQYASMVDSMAEFEAGVMVHWAAQYDKERAVRWRECDQRLKHAKLDRARKLRQRREKEIQLRKDEEVRIEREKERMADEARRREADAAREAAEADRTARPAAAAPSTAAGAGGARFQASGAAAAMDPRAQASGAAAAMDPRAQAARREPADDDAAGARPPRFTRDGERPAERIERTPPQPAAGNGNDDDSARPRLQLKPRTQALPRPDAPAPAAQAPPAPPATVDDKFARSFAARANERRAGAPPPAEDAPPADAAPRRQLPPAADRDAARDAPRAADGTARRSFGTPGASDQGRWR